MSASIWPLATRTSASIEIVVEEKTAEAKSEQGSAADFGARSSSTKSLSFVVIERKHLIREVRNQQAGEAGVIVVGGVHAHAARATPSSLRRFPRPPLFGECAVAIVAIKLVRCVSFENKRSASRHCQNRAPRHRIFDVGSPRRLSALRPRKCRCRRCARGERKCFVGFRSAIRFALAVEGA